MSDGGHQAFLVGEPLAEAVLARARQLPRKPAPVALAGRRVRLAPLDLDRDVAALHAITNGSPVTLGERQVGPYDADALVWRYLGGGPFAAAAALAAFLRPQVEAADGRCLCVFDRVTDRQIGVVNLMNNAPQHLKVELGGIWYSPVAQGVGANTEATYLLLGHAFALGYRRVEWKCDAFHVRSRRTALGLGFIFEGIQEYHFVVKGRTRDTAWYRILDREWEGVRQRLEERLGRTR